MSLFNIICFCWFVLCSIILFACALVGFFDIINVFANHKKNKTNEKK